MFFAWQHFQSGLETPKTTRLKVAVLLYMHTNININIIIIIRGSTSK